MNYDLVIIGAGPAGVNAAIEARGCGISVLVLDENRAPGGRVWQELEARGAKETDDAAALRTLIAFRNCGADLRCSAAVWAIEQDGEVFWTESGAAQSSHGAFVLIATGTTERPLSIPGWTLPGVMTVGAAQIALKTAGLVPSGATWLAGQGPLLLLYAVQALRAGGTFAGVLDLSKGAAMLHALGHVPRSLTGVREITKGLAWRREIARAGVRWISASAVRAEGNGRLERLAFRAGGQECIEVAELLLLHDGIIPSVQITRALGCAHVWDEAQRCWKPAVDDWGFTSQRNVLVAGDGAGVGGANAAALSGRIAALAVAQALGRMDATIRDAAAAPLRAERARYLSVRSLLDALYAPLGPDLPDSTIVCRCEEVTAGELRTAARLGCLGLNQLKAFTRCGMGPCQGRMCGTAAAEILADVRRVPVQEIEPYRARFPAKPVTVGELAGMGA